MVKVIFEICDFTFSVLKYQSLIQRPSDDAKNVAIYFDSNCTKGGSNVSIILSLSAMNRQ